MNVEIPGNVRLRTPDGRNCHRVSEHRFYLSPFERVQSSGFRYLRKIAPPPTRSSVTAPGWGLARARGGPRRAPAHPGGHRRPSASADSPALAFSYKRAHAVCGFAQPPSPAAPRSEPRRSLALKTAAAWGDHLFSTHWLTRVGVHPAFRLSRTPNVRAQVSCGGTFSSLAAYPGAEFPGRGVTLSGPF